MELETAQTHFHQDHCFLNTATVGLGCTAATSDLTRDLDGWTTGRLDVRAYDALVDRSRAAFATLVGGITSDDVAIISQLAAAAGVLASALGRGDEVLAAEEDFTSVLFPFLARQRDGVTVRLVPLDDLIGEIRHSTTVVAVSAAQSSDGRVIDLAALASTADAHSALTFLDTTQAAGWLPIGADRFSVTAAAAYKWLCCPRGSGFMTVRDDIFERVLPSAPSWYSANDRWGTTYGPPLDLANSARRFDLSPAWAAWVGAAPTLELLAGVGTDRINSHDVGLANRFRATMGLAPSNSAIVSFDRPGADEAFRAADISCASRAGLTRLSFHLYNTADDVDSAVAALEG